jgi:hypothetical protein
MEEFPYRVIDNGEVDALIFGNFVRFKTMDSISGRGSW